METKLKVERERGRVERSKGRVRR